MLTTRRRLASISSFLAVSASLMRLGDDFERAAQLGRRRAELLFELLQPLRMRLLLLAEFLHAIGAPRRTRIPACVCTRAISLSTGFSSSTAARKRLDQVADHRALEAHACASAAKSSRSAGPAPTAAGDIAWASCRAEWPAASAGTAGCVCSGARSLPPQRTNSWRFSSTSSSVRMGSADLQHVARGDRVLRHLLAHGDDFLNHQRRARERFQDGALAALDAARDFHFAIAREQRHGAHLAQVHADGVVDLFAQCRRAVRDRAVLRSLRASSRNPWALPGFRCRRRPDRPARRRARRRLSRSPGRTSLTSSYRT